MFSVSAFALESPWEKKLPFKSATIYYSMNGSMKGKKTLYVKNYGKNRAEYTDSSMNIFGMVQKQKEIKITTPDWIYTIDLTKGTGRKEANPQKYLNKEFHKLSRSKQKKVIKNSKKMAIDLAKNMSGDVKLKAKKILGYMCDKATLAGITTYSITGTDLVLKSTGNVMGMKIDEQAIKIKKGSAPSSKFKIPKGIKITYDKRSDEMTKQNAKMIIQNLLQGKKTLGSSGNYAGGHMGATNADGHQMTPEQQQQMQQMMKMFGGQNGQ
jgi:hypothetical protein